MLDAKGVFFNTRPELLGETKGSLVTITSSAERSPEVSIENLQELFSLFESANIAIAPRDKTLKSGGPRSTDPVMLHNPKNKIWPVRDQGTSRGTCVAFTALAVLELSELRNAQAQPEETAPKNIDYSEEFIYAKSRNDFADLGPMEDGRVDPYGATFLVQAAQTLISFGVPPEESLPYRYIKNDPDWTATVSSPVSEQAAKKKLSEDAVFVTMKYPPLLNIEEALSAPFPAEDRVKVIEAYLRAGSAVAITLPVYPTANHSPWTVGNAWKTGVIPDPTEAAKAAGSGTVGHAICIIGMVPDLESAGKGWFIFRNSWGTRFGYARPRNLALDAVLAPGYGAISYAHVGQECWGMMALVSSG